jgi:hypothetical protein
MSRPPGATHSSTQSYTIPSIIFLGLTLFHPPPAVDFVGQVLELLSHINKRVKASQAIPLPLAALAAAAALPGAPPAPLPTLFTPAKSSTTSTAATPATAAVGQAGAAGSPLVRSFGLVYVDLALPRATPAEQLAAVRREGGGVYWCPMQRSNSAQTGWSDSAKAYDHMWQLSLRGMPFC